MSENTEKAMVTVKAHINQLGSAAKVIADPLLGQQLVTKFAEMYEVSITEAQRFYNREKDNFGKLISQSAALQACTPMSAYLAFGAVMKLKLSFDNGRQPLVYLIPGNRNIGTQDKPKWIQEMVAQPSPEGEKEARLSTGILKKVGQPIIVHKGDKFDKYLHKETGELTVDWKEAEIPSTTIIGSFIRIVEPDGTIVFKTFNLTDIERWKAASLKKNKGKGANALYTSGIDGQIDESFLKGKTLLHAFKGYKQVDFGVGEGFTPDVEAAKAINPNYTDDEFTDYKEVANPQIEKPQDEFTQAVNEPEPEKESVTVKVPDGDDPFK